MLLYIFTIYSITAETYLCGKFGNIGQIEIMLIIKLHVTLKKFFLDRKLDQ